MVEDNSPYKRLVPRLILWLQWDVFL